tara:strand:- start:646 stop:1308 length:663 start_codon:yes stop_codon:yes gene_type:complete
MTVPSITALPTAPARTDAPATFNTRADAFLGALYSPFSTEMNASITSFNTDFTTVNTNATAASNSAAAAAASETAAATAAGAALWVSGQAYAEGAAAIGSDSQTYRASTATSGTTDPSSSADWVKISGTVSYALKSTDYTASSGEYIVATAGSITITLPSSPVAGNFVTVKDGTGAAATTSFTVARNGSNIASSATDLTFDKNFAEITMTYINGTIGWSV